jgi:hypothetical protein
MPAPSREACSSSEICLASRGSGPRSFHPRAVVGAHACGSGDLPLHPTPTGRRGPQRRIQYHGWAALARAVDVHAVVAHSHHLTGRGIGSLGTRCGDSLVDGPGDGEGEEVDEQP